MKPMAAALTGALISGIGMYAIGTRAASNPFADTPALVQTADGRYAYVSQDALKPLALTSGTQPMAYTASPMPAGQFVTAAAPQYVTAPAPRYVAAPAPRRVSRTSVAQERVVEIREAKPKRSWQKSALVIGGSAASGAGVGAIIGGKKGALIGTALGGGAASIYEATRRR
jgi:hypothetical protein